MVKYENENDLIQRMSDICKILGHPTRIKILEFLKSGEYSVKQIQQHTGQIQAVTSQHLRIMLSFGLVKFRREGTSLIYSLNDQKLMDNLYTLYSHYEKAMNATRV